MAKKKVISIYDGDLGTLRDTDYVVPIKTFTYDHTFNNTVIDPFSKINVDTTVATFTLKLPETLEDGDEFTFIDYKRNFHINSFIINPNGHSIQGSTSNLEVDHSGTVLRLTYASDGDNFSMDIGGTSLSIFDDTETFNIAESTASGPREGKVVYLTTNENTVALARANNANTIRVIGSIVHDGDTKCSVRTRSGTMQSMQVDSMASVNTGSNIFLSTVESGKVTSIPPTTGFACLVGTSKTGTVENKTIVVLNPMIPIRL